MLLCDHCGGESTVVLTRQIKNRMDNSVGKSKFITSVVRTRQCQKCRWKWRTIERHYKPTQRPDLPHIKEKRNARRRERYHELQRKHAHDPNLVQREDALEG